MKTKRCSKCGEIKSISEFHKDKNSKDELYSQCKKCKNKKGREYCQKNKEKLREKSRKFYKNNRKKILKYRKEYYHKNKERLKEIETKHKNKNPYKYWANHTLKRHKRKGCIINISINEVAEQAKETIYCPICGIKLDWGYGVKGRFSLNSPNLDRVNNQKILNKNNIWIICWKCNRAKGQMTMKEFVEYCGMVWKKFNKKEIKNYENNKW